MALISRFRAASATINWWMTDTDGLIFFVRKAIAPTL
jgi:hypothetical protein